MAHTGPLNNLCLGGAMARGTARSPDRWNPHHRRATFPRASRPHTRCSANPAEDVDARITDHVARDGDEVAVAVSAQHIQRDRRIGPGKRGVLVRDLCRCTLSADRTEMGSPCEVVMTVARVCRITFAWFMTSRWCRERGSGSSANRRTSRCHRRCRGVRTSRPNRRNVDRGRC